MVSHLKRVEQEKGHASVRQGVHRERDRNQRGAVEIQTGKDQRAPERPERKESQRLRGSVKIPRGNLIQKRKNQEDPKKPGQEKLRRRVERGSLSGAVQKRRRPG